MQLSNQLANLITLMARLRQDCPWDKAQTNHSLIPYAIEESYELAEAIQTGQIDDIKAELGDVLLQVVFHSQLYAEQGLFDLSDVIYTLQEKLIRRHPHVFDKENLTDEAAVKHRWQQIKAVENAGKPKRKLDAVKAGSGLMQAQALQKQASQLGFDWDDVSGAQAKLTEELVELSEVMHSNNQVEIEKELGDCFFALVNVARKLNVNSEMALLTTIHKFRTRFGFIEDELAKQGKTPETATLAEMDALWEHAKIALKK